MITGTRYRLAVEIARQTKLSGEIARVQAEISTGKKILAPSDDPTASATISELARRQAEEAAWMRNLDTAAIFASRADTALASVANRVTRASELIIGARSGTLSQENRETLAAELRGIANDIATLAASRDQNGNDLFRTDAPLEIPVHGSGTVAPVASRAALFGSVSTAAGLRDLATIMSDAADAVEEPDATLRAVATATAMDEINAAIAHVAAARGDQGVRANRIDELRERFELSAISLDEQRGSLEGIDLVDAMARLQGRQLGLQAAQAVFARINQSTLFDLLR
ncbi:flagellin [Sphingosinicella sp. LY1275]|uniref:flagellin N-terminal helical domain-containing protein n=1 Tax=Sphingosinicella sp. LY1275 TaxID=3095379 RepID=UPI002ADEC3C9|nr:flagellin [Sphingosinicella sp. LY1275]MEA1015923.1 flagellin [Sphingosinicella sp. LY1275]